MAIDVGTIVGLLVLLIFLVILVLVGRWAIATMGLGEPWPTVMILVVVAILLIVLVRLFFGGGSIRIGASSYGDLVALARLVA